MTGIPREVLYGVKARAQVDKLASVAPSKAAGVARRIKHPWYRSQALAMAAEHSRGSERAKLLEASINAAREQDEPNRVVSVSSWPARVMANAMPEAAYNLVSQLVDIAKTEPHNLRRAHALQMLAVSVSDHAELLKLIIPTLSDAILGGHGPCIDRVIRDTFDLVRKTNPELLHPLALHHKANGQQAKLLAAI